MAAYREHVSVSSLLGLGVGAGAYFALGFTPIQGALAGWLTALGGMLPDLDSQTGRPVREMFGLVAAIAPLALVNRVIGWLGLDASSIEMVMLLIVLMYLMIKYGGQMLIGAIAVHRGMFHSLPAMVIAAEITYLVYPHESARVKLLMGGGVAIGFFSHLLLDEMYSVQWSGVRIKVKKSAGSAIKMFGKLFVPNVITYSLLAVLTWAVLVDVGFIQPTEPQPLFQTDAAELGPADGESAQPGGDVLLETALGDASLDDTQLGSPAPDVNPFEDAAGATPDRTADADGLILPNPGAFDGVSR